MVWLLLALLCMVSWGMTDIFYKKGSPREDSLSCYKFMVCLGIIMGILMLVLIPMSESGTHLLVWIFEDVLYILIPLSYPLAVMVGLNGKRYLDISVASPLENVDGAIAPIIILLYFFATGTIGRIDEMVSVWDLLGIALVVISVVLIGRIEQKLSRLDIGSLADGTPRRIGAKALIFPIVYSIFDAICTAASGIVLYDGGNFAIGEVDFLIVESFAFVLIGIFSYIHLWRKMKRPYNPFRKSESIKFAGGILELFGNVCYTYAVAINPVLVTPITSSYCLVTMIAARRLLKEKLKKSQYFCLGILIVGILVLAFSEGMK